MSRSPRNSEKRSSRNDFYRGDNNKTERRTLFNPQSDHPVAFNAKSDDTNNRSTNQRASSSQRRRQGLEQQQRSFSIQASDRATSDECGNGRPSRGVLWDPNAKPVPKKEATPAKTDNGVATMTPEEQEHRMRLKTLLARIQKLQAKITQADDAASTDHPYFRGMAPTKDRQQRGDDAFVYDRQHAAAEEDPIHPWLTMTLDSPLWESTDRIWKDKMQLHLQLANAYLDIIQLDDGFAETNHLTSLCWKRAIYSLVEQFRQAFARQQALLAAAAAANKSESATTDNDSDLEEADFVPVMTENGMAMVPVSDGEDEDVTDKATLQSILDKHLAMLRRWMDTFLLVADGYYQRVMVVLRDLEKQDDELERSLDSWWRSKRWKWYRCIPYRGDLARYRFIYGQNKSDYALAWRWYSLGVWMTPATGRFYFHQSLLLNSPQYSPLYELHKLYFGVRSLMVRRNGFVNAREGLVTLFENNRQWHTTTVTTKPGKNKAQRRRQQLKNKTGNDPKTLVEPDKMISGLFICLHGMLFTKINLDAFTQTKRQYFETLFSSTLLTAADTTHDSLPSPQQQHASATLSCQQMFWLETIVLNLSSLYRYDYASSIFTKALALNKASWVAKHNGTGDDRGSSTQQNGNWEDVLESLDDDPLFGHSIDMICQVVVELVSRSMNNVSELLRLPALPALPPVELNLKANESLLFGTDDTAKSNGDATDMENNTSGDQPWLIYIYIFLHWMVITGIGVAGGGGDKSMWERVIGQVATKTNEATSNNMDKITRTFWPLLMSFLTRLLQELPETERYQLIDRHLLDTNNPWMIDEQQQHQGDSWDDYIMHLMGACPALPEDDYLRGLGWLDQALSDTGKNDNRNDIQVNPILSMDMDLRRRIRILDYGFALVKQMHQSLEYDPVQEAFMIKPLHSPLFEKEDESGASAMILDQDDDTEILPILTAMDDAVLFDSTNELVDEGAHQGDYDDPLLHESGDETDDDDMMGQLKKRRQHLQSMLANMTEEKRHAATYGYQKLTAQGRGKEREARLNRIREKVIPRQTVLVLDTNCFIGHMDAIRKLIQSGIWSVVIPLVVITELDGLKGNAAPLGTVAEQALQLIETALASKQTRPDAIRIQTSHHNFMYDISIRSEQFIFGETDKNLDDLILSTCLWWNNNKKQHQQSMGGVPVCLVTADRNLSVKARARDVQVVPVSALMKINPSIP